VPDEEIREGVRRIGKVVREQLGLFGTLAGSSGQASGPPAAEPAGEQSTPLADVVALPRRKQEGSARRRLDR